MKIAKLTSLAALTVVCVISNHVFADDQPAPLRATNAPAVKPLATNSASTNAPSTNAPAAAETTAAPIPGAFVMESPAGTPAGAKGTNGAAPVLSLATTNTAGTNAMTVPATNNVPATNAAVSAMTSTNLPDTSTNQLTTATNLPGTNSIVIQPATNAATTNLLAGAGTNVLTVPGLTNVVGLPLPPMAATNAGPTNLFPVIITVSTNLGPMVPTNYMGLSFEAAQLFTNAEGLYYFRPDNQPLIDLFHTLGVKNLRIGGNTSDRDAKQLPSTKDLDSLFSFAKAAGVKVIYCLQLHNGSTVTNIRTAKYIMDRYAPLVECFSIGQEPSAYPTEKRDTRAQGERMGATNEKYQYTQYRLDWKKMADALIAAVPDIRFCGPSVHNNGEWARRFMDDFGKTNHVVMITEHLYPGGAGGKIPSPEIGIDRMLASDSMSEMTNGFPKAYQKLYESFVPQADTNRLPYRLEEVNNYFNGGATNVSNTFASALWGLDFMYWWVSHSAAGINFHTGDKVAAGASLLPSKYTAYHTVSNGFYVRPLGYGIKAFDLGSHGRLVPLTLTNAADLNLTAYAVRNDSKTYFFTIINREHGTNSRDADVTIELNDPAYRYAEAVWLLAPTNANETATSDITLGGAAVQTSGHWDGHWSIIQRPEKGACRLKVPACSAIVIACFPANYDEAMVGKFVLPDPILSLAGVAIQDSDDWANVRRGQILKQYEGYIYGTPPKWRNMIDKIWDADAHAFGGKALRKQVNLEFYNYNQISGRPDNIVFHLLMYTPTAATNKVPTFLCLSMTPNYRSVSDTNVVVYPVWDRKTNLPPALPKTIVRGDSHTWPVEEIIDRGYGVVLIDYNDIEPDLVDGSGWKHGVRSLYLKATQTNLAPDDWGALGAWSWGASRILDYLETDQNVDARHVAIVGHSRLGKSALWAGAEDKRFAMVIASCSGEMGAALSRRDYGETVTSMCKSFPYQFCPNFLDYSNKVDKLPVDSHMLLALIAPRPLFLNTGSEDRWSDPRGEFEAAVAATPVYRLFGKEGVVTNLPPDIMTNAVGSGPLMRSEVLESYPMPPADTVIMRDVVFHMHTGKHDILSSDWDKFLDFADFHFSGRLPPQYSVSTQ